MLRAIITAVLITVVAVHLGASTDDAMGYSLAVAGGVWYLWPVLRRVPRAGRSAHRALFTPRRRTARPTRSAQRVPVRTGPTGPSATPLPPALTQINHHHHYYGEPPHQQWPAGGEMPRPGLLGLPRRGHQQIAHDNVFTGIDTHHD